MLLLFIIKNLVGAAVWFGTALSDCGKSSK